MRSRAMSYAGQREEGCCSLSASRIDATFIGRTSILQNKYSNWLVERDGREKQCALMCSDSAGWEPGPGSQSCHGSSLTCPHLSSHLSVGRHLQIWAQGAAPLCEEGVGLPFLHVRTVEKFYEFI